MDIDAILVAVRDDLAGAERARRRYYEMFSTLAADPTGAGPDGTLASAVDVFERCVAGDPELASVVGCWLALSAASPSTALRDEWEPLLLSRLGSTARSLTAAAELLDGEESRSAAAQFYRILVQATAEPRHALREDAAAFMRDRSYRHSHRAWHQSSSKPAPTAEEEAETYRKVRGDHGVSNDVTGLLNVLSSLLAQRGLIAPLSELGVTGFGTPELDDEVATAIRQDCDAVRAELAARCVAAGYVVRDAMSLDVLADQMLRAGLLTHRRTTTAKFLGSIRNLLADPCAANFGRAQAERYRVLSRALLDDVRSVDSESVVAEQGPTD